MSTVVEPQISNEETTNNAATRLRSTMAASRVSFTWFGTTKSLTEEQKATVANSFGAESDVLSTRV